MEDDSLSESNFLLKNAPFDVSLLESPHFYSFTWGIFVTVKVLS